MTEPQETALAWLDAVRWNADGLVCAIAQDADDGTVLMQAWMNREALLETWRTGVAVYWSRSRGKLWRKGEESGHVQYVRAIALDCDGDAVLLTVQQIGGVACHTGRKSCFYRTLVPASAGEGQAPTQLRVALSSVAEGAPATIPAPGIGTESSASSSTGHSSTSTAQWQEILPILRSPEEMYRDRS